MFGEEYRKAQQSYFNARVEEQKQLNARRDEKIKEFMGWLYARKFFWDDYLAALELDS